MNFEQMSVDELWNLREEIGRVLELKLIAEKQKLQERLIRLARASKKPEYKPQRRPYPEVSSK